MLTAKGQELDRQKGQEVGADIYMTKPFDPEAILNKAKEVLGLNNIVYRNYIALYNMAKLTLKNICRKKIIQKH